MSVEFCLYCPETGHSVDVGANLADSPRNTAESDWVVSLFCAAHAFKEVIVTVITDGSDISWDQETALEHYTALTGKDAPEEYVAAIIKE